MRTYVMGFVFLFLVNAFANAQNLNECEQLVSQRAQQVPAVTLDTQSHRIEVQLESSFWSGNYGLNILVDGQVYAAFGEYARGLFTMPIVFKNARSLSSSLGALEASMSALIRAATLQKSAMTVDFAHLRGVAGYRRCAMDGDSIEKVVSVYKPVEKPEEKPEEKPDEEVTVAADRSARLPEGQEPPGKVLEPNGDR